MKLLKHASQSWRSQLFLIVLDCSHTHTHTHTRARARARIICRVSNRRPCHRVTYLSSNALKSTPCLCYVCLHLQEKFIGDEIAPTGIIVSGSFSSSSVASPNQVSSSVGTSLPTLWNCNSFQCFFPYFTSPKTNDVFVSEQNQAFLKKFPIHLGQWWQNSENMMMKDWEFAIESLRRLSGERPVAWLGTIIEKTASVTQQVTDYKVMR